MRRKTNTLVREMYRAFMPTMVDPEMVALALAASVMMVGLELMVKIKRILGI